MLYNGLNADENAKAGGEMGGKSKHILQDLRAEQLSTIIITLQPTANMEDRPTLRRVSNIGPVGDRHRPGENPTKPTSSERNKVEGGEAKPPIFVAFRSQLNAFMSLCFICP